MQFSRNGLLSDSGGAFDDSLRPSLPTVAEPSWFAPPLDVQENQEAMTLLFEVASADKAELRVEVNGTNLFLWGRRLRRRGSDELSHRAMRVFALPFAANGRALRSEWSGNVLRVRIAKKKSHSRASEPVSDIA